MICTPPDDACTVRWPGVGSIREAVFLLAVLLVLLSTVLVVVAPSIWPSVAELRVRQLLAGDVSGPVALGPEDHVEVESADCGGRCLGYLVRVSGDGTLTKDEWGLTCSPGRRETKLGPVQAQRLLAALQMATGPLFRLPAQPLAPAGAWVRWRHDGRMTSRAFELLPEPGERQALERALRAIDEAEQAHFGPPRQMALDGTCPTLDGGMEPVVAVPKRLEMAR